MERTQQISGCPWTYYIIKVHFKSIWGNEIFSKWYLSNRSSIVKTNHSNSFTFTPSQFILKFKWKKWNNNSGRQKYNWIMLSSWFGKDKYNTNREAVKEKLDNCMKLKPFKWLKMQIIKTKKWHRERTHKAMYLCTLHSQFMFCGSITQVMFLFLVFLLPKVLS